MGKNFKDVVPGDKVYCVTLDENFSPGETKEKIVQNIRFSGVCSMWITIDDCDEVFIEPNRSSFIELINRKTTIIGTSESAMNDQLQKHRVNSKQQLTHRKYMIEQKLRNLTKDLEDINKALEHLKDI